jgi:hypothetical protein
MLSLHCVVKLTLAEGPQVALIQVEDAVKKQQSGTLVNPMAAMPAGN